LVIKSRKNKKSVFFIQTIKRLNGFFLRKPLKTTQKYPNKGIFSKMSVRYFYFQLDLISMKFFYISSNPSIDGQFEIHDRDCPLVPLPNDRDYLGPFNSGKEALAKGKELNSDAKLCSNCCISSFQTIIKSKI
jgi:hypothetical protein